jgi:THUMP domain-like
MTSRTELADYQWLTGAEAAAVLVDLAGRAEPLHVATARLRKQHSPERVHLLVELAELRGRAAAKFARSDEMFFTRLGLEQATDQWVAAYKASRFALLAGGGNIADLCCGIGGDLLALGGEGSTVGVDRDPIAACFAAANVRAAGLCECVTLETREIDTLDVGDFAAWHIDPDRRPTGKRTTALDWSSPGVNVVERLLAESPHAAIKLAPAADSPPNWNERCELEWISRDRQCRQLVAWHGDLAQHPGKRRATMLAPEGNTLRSVVGVPNQQLPFAADLDQFLFEPEPAVLAAHLTGALAAEHGLSAFSPGVAYLTGPAVVEDPALACFAVEEIMPLNLRKIDGHLRGRNIGQLEIKKRGVEHDPATVRKQLHLDGEEAATLFLTKLGSKHTAILARRTLNSQT